MSDKPKHIQKVKTCDNSQCHNWHGIMKEDGTAPRLFSKDMSVDVDLTETQQIQLGNRVITVCKCCEHAVDMFFGYYKHALTPNPKLK